MLHSCIHYAKCFIIFFNLTTDKKGGNILCENRLFFLHVGICKYLISNFLQKYVKQQGFDTIDLIVYAYFNILPYMVGN